MTSQLTLDLPCRSALGREDFMVTACNETAVAMIDRWPDWPGQAVLLHGPAGSGKSHLAAAWRTRAGGAWQDATALDVAQVPQLVASRSLVLDHADRTSDWAGLLHLVNLMREDGGYLLLLAGRPLAAWNVSLPDLRSRLAAMQTTRIAEPDDRLLSAVMLKMLADRQLRAPADLVPWLASRIERSFAAAAAIIAALDREAMREGRAVSVALARKLLAQMPEIGDTASI